MTKADILRGRGNGHMIYMAGRQSGKTAQELEKFKNETGYNSRVVINKDNFKHFNITAEDIEDMGFHNFAKEIIGEPDFTYIPPEKIEEMELEKFDLYVKGLWERQKGDVDGN